MSRERMLRNLDWNLLYTFWVIVEEGSVTGAARKLSLSQPSISNALKRLESYLGVQLIVRRKGVFALTYQGQRVYDYAASASSILGQLANQFATDEQVLQGEIDIQIASYIHCPPFDQTLADFHANHPQVLLTLNTHPSAEIVSAVAEGALRIGICNKKVARTGLRFDFLGYEKMAFYCGRRHPLYHKTELSLEDLQGLPYVSFESDQPGEGLGAVAQLRAEQGFWGQLVAVSSNDEEVRRLIMAGVGFGALTVEGARPFVEQGVLRQLPPYDKLPMTEVFLVTRENSPLSEAESRFVTMLRGAVMSAAQHLC